MKMPAAKSQLPQTGGQAAKPTANAQAGSVYLYEPHWLVQQVLAARLKLIPGLRLQGATGNLRHALAAVARLRPRVVVACVAARKGLPAELLDLAKQQGGPQLIVLDLHWNAERAAAVGELPDGHYLLKKLPWTALAATIADVVQKEKTSPARAPKKYEYRA